MSDYLRSAGLLFALLNPLLMIVYLVDLVERLDRQRFAAVLLRAALIAGAVFCCFAVLGDAIFSSLIQAEFASFQIFGGVIFLLVGIQFVFRGPAAIEILRGESEYLAGAIAMPVLIGPGTVSACVVIGKRHNPLMACALVMFAVLACALVMLAIKILHDVLRPHDSRVAQRYVEISGRMLALYTGTVSIEMIMQGLRTWVQKF
jgi:multiple antibiotic resistance protein